MIRFGLQSGLRREEIATFPAAYIHDPDRAGPTKRNICIHLDPRDGHGMRTKGSVPRDIYISRRYMRDLHHYVIHTRGLRASLSTVRYPNLFVNQCGKPYADHGKGIERIVRQIGRRAGIEVHPHMLRHTYATYTLCAAQRYDQFGTEFGMDALVYVQNQLGHASIQTTTGLLTSGQRASRRCGAGLRRRTERLDGGLIGQEDQLRQVAISLSVVDPAGPFAHLTLDETEGTAIADSSGNGRGGTLEVGVGSATLNQDPLASGKAIEVSEGGAVRLEGKQYHLL